MSEANRSTARALMMREIVRIGFRIFAKEFQQRLFGFRHESSRDGFVNIGVAWRSAPLAAHAIAPHTIFFARPVRWRSGQRRQGSCTQFEKTGVEILRCGACDDLAATVLPVKKIKSNDNFRSSVFLFFASGHDGHCGRVEILGTRSSNTSVVAGSASLNVRRQVFPAASAANAGRISSSKAR